MDFFIADLTLLITVLAVVAYSTMPEVIVPNVSGITFFMADLTLVALAGCNP